MSDSLNPIDRAELIAFISEFVQEHYRSANLPANGAQLDLAIKQRFPKFSYIQLGLEKLGDAVRLAEEQGLVSRNWHVKHLEIFPPHVLGAERVERPKPQAERRFLRKEVWQALVYFQQWESPYLDRETAEVITVPPGQLAAYDSNPKYVKIDSIPESTHKAWMRQFLAINGFPDANVAPVDVDQWWYHFPEWLKTRGQTTLKAWLAYRAQQVLNYARTWATEKDISSEKLFSVAAVTPIPKTNLQEDDATRRAILAALGEMSTEELANLAIPVRYLLRHFKVR